MIPPSRILALAGLLLLACWSLPLLHGCSGSGATSPLTPANSTKPDSVNVEVSDTVYWVPEALTPPVTDSLNAVAVLSKKLGYICGNNGTVLKFDGDKWSRLDVGLAKNENLLALAFSSENEGWMVGSHGTILAYRNGAWTQDPSPTQETLYDIAVTGSRSVWACGANGTLLTYNGVSWGKVPVLEEVPGASPVTLLDDLYGLDLSDANNGWAVGARGRLLRYDGSVWTPVASNTTEKLNAVHVVSGVQAWAVGAFGTILRFNGTTWNKMGTAYAGVDLFQVRFRREDDGWVIGQDGTILYYDGTKWITQQKQASKPSLNGLAFHKEEGWMVGSSGALLKFHASGDGGAAAIQFKGEVAKAPSRDAAGWTLAYSASNKGTKLSAFLTFELPVPKGLEAVPENPKGSTATPQASPSLPPPIPMGAKPAVTPGALEWKLKDGKVIWELGSLSASESKGMTVVFREKKDQKWDLPLVMKASLKQQDRAAIDAAPITLLAAPASPVPTPPTRFSTPAR